jgi:DNA-directed RNA polymerase specialized sigma24 family protein
MALTPESFDCLLGALGPEREAAGERYEVLRRRLLIFFAARGAAPAEELADEALDRAARRVAEGVALEPSIESYVLGIARNVVREQWKRPRAIEVDWARMAAEAPSVEDPRAVCLDECLRGLAPQSRQWVERFYSHQGGEKIRARESLAADLGIDANALRVRLHRIRTKLAECVTACLRRNETGGKAIYERG